MLMAYLQHETGVGTLLDTRRTRDYDPDNLVDQYLNLEEVQVSSWDLCLDQCSASVCSSMSPGHLCSKVF